VLGLVVFISLNYVRLICEREMLTTGAFLMLGSGSQLLSSNTSVCLRVHTALQPEDQRRFRH
jgi:hypothetical protein